MTPEALTTAIKNGKLPLVLYLYGAETFLIQANLPHIEQRILPSGSEDFNRQLFYAKATPVDEIINAALTLPFFAERRLVLVKDAQALSATDYDALLPYIQDPSPSTCLVFCGEKIDSRRKFFQTLKKLDALVEFKSLSDKQLPGFVTHKLEDTGFSITGDALSLFVSRVGVGLHEVMTELEKLCLYVGQPRLIDIPDIQAVISSIKAENVFGIANAVGCQKPGEALRLVRSLLAEGEAPLKILALLVRHFRQLWKTRELQVGGESGREIAKRVGVPPFVIDGLIAQGRRYSRRDFRRTFRLFVDADLAMKSSGSQPEVVLENLMLQLAHSQT